MTEYNCPSDDLLEKQIDEENDWKECAHCGYGPIHIEDMDLEDGEWVCRDCEFRGRCSA